MDNESTNDAPKNTVMKILIGIFIFVFVGIPILVILLIAGLVAVGQSLESTFENVQSGLEAEP